MELLTHPASLVVLGLLVATLLAWAHHRYWVAKLSVTVRYAELARIDTPDASAIELRRLEPPALPSLPPVLMVHGVGANHRNVDPEPDRSLARYLSRRGRDVWLLTLRSGRADRSLRERRRMRFSAMAEHDVPLAVAHVLERTGARALDYVGFSMGGMLLFAALGRHLDPARLRRAVIIGAPGRIVPPHAFVRALARVPRWAVPSLLLRLVSRMAAVVLELLPLPLEHLIFNRANVPKGSIARALVDIVEDIPGPLQADFHEWIAHGGELRVDGEPILPRIGAVTTPALFFAGARDRLAPPESVRAGYDAWGALTERPDKRLVLLAKAQGAAADYGHGDLAIGASLERDLFEPAAAFLGEA